MNKVSNAPRQLHEVISNNIKDHTTKIYRFDNDFFFS